jgi:hypothetical protein
MRNEPPMSDSDLHDPDEHAGRSRQNIVAVVIVLLLLGGGWWLMSELQHHREVENCIASGRHDCVPITPEPSR